MKNYLKPELLKIKLTSKEQVLTFCYDSSENGEGGCWTSQLDDYGQGELTPVRELYF